MSDPHAEYFALLRVCLLEPPPPGLVAALAGRSGDLSLRGAHPDLGRGWRRLERFFDSHPRDEAGEAASRAHRVLLGHPFSPKLEPYASTYLEGHRLGTPLVRLRQFLADWQLKPDRERYRDLEDHAAFLLDCLCRLGQLREAEGDRWAEAYRICLVAHVLPWMPRFFEDLEREDDLLEWGGFYAGLARLGCGVLALEAAAAGYR